MAANRDSVRRMNSILLDWLEEELKDPQKQELILSKIGLFYHPSRLVLIAMSIGSCSVTIAPGVTIILQLFHRVDPIVYNLGVPLKAPWDTTNGGIPFYTEYFLMISTFLSITFATAIDSLFAYYSFVIVSLFEALSYEFENFVFTRKNESKMISLIKRHQLLLSCRRNLEKCYGPIIFAFYITCAVTMCTLLYELYMVIFYFQIHWKYFVGIISCSLGFCLFFLFFKMKKIQVGIVITAIMHFSSKGLQAFIYSYYAYAITLAVSTQSNTIQTFI